MDLHLALFGSVMDEVSPVTRERRDEIIQGITGGIARCQLDRFPSRGRRKTAFESVPDHHVRFVVLSFQLGLVVKHAFGPLHDTGGHPAR